MSASTLRPERFPKRANTSYQSVSTKLKSRLGCDGWLRTVSGSRCSGHLQSPSAKTVRVAQEVRGSRNAEANDYPVSEPIRRTAKAIYRNGCHTKDLGQSALAHLDLSDAVPESPL